MTDILLGLILVVLLMLWADQSAWWAVRMGRARRLTKALRRKLKNWKHRRRING